MNGLRDCGCLHHDGPHWLHMEAVDIGLQAAQLEAGNVRGYIHVLGHDLDACIYNRQAAGQHDGEPVAGLLRRLGWSEESIARCVEERRAAQARLAAAFQALAKAAPEGSDAK